MPRKTTTIVECSQSDCKEVAQVGQDPNEAPEGWYQVVPSSESAKLGHTYDRSNGNVFEFHSLRCVEKWAKARRQFETGTSQRTNDVPMTQQLLDAAREYGDPFTPEELLQVMGLTGEVHMKSITAALNRMGREGQLIVIQPGKPFGEQTPIYRAKQKV